MPAPYPEEFRRRAITLVREEGRPIGQVARELASPSRACADGWTVMTSTRVAKEGLTSAERDELVKLRRENRTLRGGP